MSREWLWGLVLFARAVLFGAALGLYYEVFRVLRLLFPHPAWLAAAEDLLFFLPASLAHIFFHYACGEGETRWFSVLGVVLGFVLYLLSAGKIVQKLLRRVKRFLIQKILFPLKERFAAGRERRREVRAKRRRAKQDRKNKKKEQKTEKAV